LDGTDENWQMFDDFLRASSFDEDHILGLRVVPNKKALDSEYVRGMRARFDESIQGVGLQGEFAVEVGSNPVQIINKRAAWVDFVIVNGARPPGNLSLTRISPQMKLLVQQCPRPIQVRPDGSQSDYSRAILAYDGSPKADEALFIATYLTSRWAKSLTVVTVETAYTKASALERAQRYIGDHGLSDVNYVLKKGPIAESVMETAESFDCNLLFMGGFSFPSLRQLTLGSSAERILREFPYPMWICR
jgi:nucleotide-binding universal stress UspA family protein